ncbi:MAG TPA: sigma-54 dependent transcriptional regulator [Gemmataceae bacterium]|jgi:DNA-binding NtrC family response regulator
MLEGQDHPNEATLLEHLPQLGHYMAATTHPSIKLLVVDDDEDMRHDLLHLFRKQGHEVTAASSGEDALAKAAQARFDVALLDLHLPGISGIDVLVPLKELQPEMEVLMLTAHSSIETAVQAMKRGAYDYLTKPFRAADLEVHIQKAFEKVQLQRREQQWLRHLSYESPRYRLVGSSTVMRKVVGLIEKVAGTDATVLVRGASGTGKELVARALHTNSPRKTRPLVTINCAALQENLLESELFGHEKGAFTGAVAAKPGLVEVAEGGTLFIDEIGEMAPGLQAKLLRVLEDGHYRRVGGTQEMRADVRVVAATNRDLAEEIKAGRFREDLYYRLNVVSIHLPPLRERREDVPELIEHFLTTRQVGPMRCRMHPDAMRALMAYRWPGNVRELANVLERAQILCENHVITPEDLPETIVAASPLDAGASGEPRHLNEVERRHVQAILQEEKGNKVHAARVLGISRRSLYRLIEKYHLE